MTAPDRRAELYDDGYWPVSEHGRCPKCGRFTLNRVAHKNEDKGWITAECTRCGPVELEVVGWRNDVGDFV